MGGMFQFFFVSFWCNFSRDNFIHNFINGFATSLTFCNALFPQRNKSPCKVIETCRYKALVNYLGM